MRRRHDDQPTFGFATPAPIPSHCARIGTGTIPASDPNVIRSDRKRLAGQNLLIYERLKRGPVTNEELSEISLKYTSRISDIREHGHNIECERGPGGLSTYYLREAPGSDAADDHA